jgi:hypothetical protein
VPYFRKKPFIIKADRWFSVEPFVEGQPRIVDYFRHPDISGDTQCEICGRRMHDHGWIDTLEGGHRVCPGDWIITGVKGERYPCKPDIFAATYEAVED